MSAIERDRDDDSDLYPRGPMPTEKPTEDLHERAEEWLIKANGEIKVNEHLQAWGDAYTLIRDLDAALREVVAERDEAARRHAEAEDSNGWLRQSISTKEKRIASLNESLQAAGALLDEAAQEAHAHGFLSDHHDKKAKGWVMADFETCTNRLCAEAREFVARQKEDKDK